MKTRDIANSHGFHLPAFDAWLRASSIPHRAGVMGGLSIENTHDIDEAVNSFRAHQAAIDEREAAESASKEAAERQKQQILANMLITSGFSFDGYQITKYSGYISGDDVIQVERGTHGFFSSATNVGESLMSSLATVRRKALAELKEAALDLGCNAVIGVDFDYLTLDPQTANSSGGTIYLPYVFGVTANGNAVIIEKV